MKLRLTLLLAAALSAQLPAAAQDAAPPTDTALSVPQPSPPPIGAPVSTRAKGFYVDGWKDIGLGVPRDQKAIWLFPFSVARGHHLKPTLAVLGVTAGLIGVDQYITGYFYRTNSFDRFNQTFSGPNTALATEVIPAALFAVGLARRDTYAQRTFFLAGQAVIDAEILTSVMKDIDRRAIPANGNFTETWFDKTDGHYLGGKGSFPSGHTIAAFAVATMYADRYPNPRWHRWVAYGLAGLIGFSRVSIHAHYASDVFAGAALGYAISHYVVFRSPSQ